jgi:hypothetical protein
VFADGPRLVLLTALLASTLAAAGSAAQPALEVTAAAGPVAVGDRVPVRVQARGEDGMWGDLTVRVTADGPWAVVDGPHEIDGARPPAWELVLVPLRVDRLELPEMTATLRTGDGQVQSVEPAEVATVTVASVLPPDEEVAPAPLRAPLGTHGFPWEWAVPILLVLVPALALQHWWLRRRRAVETGEDSFLPPLEQLEALTAELSADAATIPSQIFCDRLASGFRRFLERRTGDPALEMTSFELRVLARNRRWPEPVQRAMHRVLEVVDGVRFGRRSVPHPELVQAAATALDGGRALERHLAPAATEDPVEAAS